LVNFLVAEFTRTDVTLKGHARAVITRFRAVAENTIVAGFVREAFNALITIVAERLGFGTVIVRNAFYAAVTVLIANRERKQV